MWLPLTMEVQCVVLECGILVILAQQLFGLFDMAGNNGIPNVFAPPNVQPHHGTNGNGTVPDQPKPAENIKVQIACNCFIRWVLVDNSAGINLDEPMRTLGTSTRNIQC